MKVTIFGATGRTGKHLVKKSLEAGYKVTAYARSPEKLGIEHPNLNVVQSELTDRTAVSRAIKGADAVLSGLGAVRGGNPQVMVSAANSILPAMQEHNVKRLIWAAGAGVPAPEDQPAFIHRVIELLLKLTAREVLEDSLAGAELIQNSELDWTIARGPMLTDDPGTGQYRAGFVSGEMGRTLSREDFADFMLKQIKSSEWLKKMPAVSNI